MSKPYRENNPPLKDPAWCQTDPPDDQHLEDAYDASHGEGDYDGYFDQYDEPDMDIYSGEYSEL